MRRTLLLATLLAAGLTGPADAASYTVTTTVKYAASNGVVVFACDALATTDTATVAMTTAVDDCSFDGTAATPDGIQLNGAYAATGGTASAGVGDTVSVCVGGQAVFGPTPVHIETNATSCETITVATHGVVTVA